MTPLTPPLAHRLVRLCLGLAAILLLPAGPAPAGKAPINGNLHPIDPSDSDLHPPFETLAASDNTSASAYHVDRNQVSFDKARSYYNWEKPRIYSDDASFDGNTTQKGYITSICSEINDAIEARARGVEHFEHLEFSLVNRGLRGAILGGYNTWVNDQGADLAAKEMMRWFGEHVRDTGCSGMSVGGQVVPLSPNGTLERATSGNLRRLLWNGNPATLIGFGFMGALAAGDRTILVQEGTPPATTDGLLGTLRQYGANFMRIWSIEQWTGLAVCPGATPHAQGLTPFAGAYPDYDLSIAGLNPAFFSRLREFSQLAADRGIAVQLSLFDKHGLVNFPCISNWAGSPYNKDINQTNPPFIDGSGLNDDCGCTPCSGLEFGEPEDPPQPPTCNTINAIFRNASIRPIHDAYIRRVAQEVGGTGNMIFEIMNEMYYGYDWASIGEAWQRDYAACLLNKELPVFVARDAFNDEVDGQGLYGKAPDAGMPAATWAAGNAGITVAEDPETGIAMGYARGRSLGTTMRGALELDASNSWTELGVRANVSRKGNNMELGFSTGGNPTGNVVRVELGTPLILGACTRVAIVKRVGTGTPIELAATCIQVEDGAEIHFLLNVITRQANVRLDSAPVTPLSNIYVGSSLPSGLSHAYFRGSKTQAGNYTADDGAIDNFEADVYYRNPAVSCPVP